MAIHHSRVDLSIKRANGFDERRNSSTRMNPGEASSTAVQCSSSKRGAAEAAGKKRLAQ